MSSPSTWRWSGAGRPTPSGRISATSGRCSNFVAQRAPDAGRSAAVYAAGAALLAGRAGRRRGARTTLARRTSAVKTFTAWATRRGLTATDPSTRLQTPKAHRTLPAVLRAGSGHSTPWRAAKSGAAEGDPMALRDRLIVELLYATGIRVSELCGLDIDDVDLSRRLLRVLGKGNKQRTAAVRRARRGRAARLAGRRPAGVGDPGLGARAAARSPGQAARARAGAHRRAPDGGRGRRRARYRVRTDCGTVPPRTCSRAAPTCGSCRNCSATRRWRRRSSTPTSPSPGCGPCTTRRTRGREREVRRRECARYGRGVSTAARRAIPRRAG